MKPAETTTVINRLYCRSIRLSEALLVSADLLPDLSPLLRRELELVADKICEAANKLQEIRDCHTANPLPQGDQ